MDAPRQKIRISWYRSPLTREQLRDLNQRSDFKGFVQTLGFLGLLALTATAVIYGTGRWPWWAIVGLLLVHGTFWSFLINGFHELGHESVFKTRWLNGFFLRIFSFLGWYNHHVFATSHMEHHKYTLHPPDDLEVILPFRGTIKEFCQRAVFNPMEMKYFVDTTERLAHGKLDGEWVNARYPASDPAARRRLFNWARILLVGHGLIVVVSAVMHWWMVPVVIVLPHCYAGGMFYLCNNTQHTGLRDNVPDFRLCCRTITLNPVLEFLYWHMNYHTEHHMYAAVPCYNLGKLHQIIKADLPHCPHGLVETWKQIGEIMARQKIDPTYQYNPELPSRGSARPSLAPLPASPTV